VDYGQSSAEPTGDRRIWDTIWKTDVPQKVRIFAWRAAANSLAVKDNLHRRIHKIDPVCSICGMEDEDVHHALIRCTLAKALRQEMRTVLSLPSNIAFNVTGKEWLLHLLQQLSPNM
jgi:ABC-type taurine transport system substrate-binding protein